MFETRNSEDRGVGTIEWLDARFTCSFAPYRDPVPLEAEIGVSFAA